MSLGRMWTRKLALDFAFLGVVILPSARVNSEKGNVFLAGVIHS